MRMKIQGTIHLSTGSQVKARGYFQSGTGTREGYCSRSTSNETSFCQKEKSDPPAHGRRNVMLSIMVLGTTALSVTEPALAEEADVPLKKRISEHIAVAKHLMTMVSG